MSTTNETGAFVRVAPDCPATVAQIPPQRATAPTVAQLQYEILIDAPYRYTSDDVLFLVHAARAGFDLDDVEETAAARAEFFGTPQACFRASPLTKRYGWGLHHDDQSRLALVPLGSDRYAELAADAELKQLEAMRSRRA